MAGCPGASLRPLHTIPPPPRPTKSPVRARFRSLLVALPLSARPPAPDRSTRRLLLTSGDKVEVLVGDADDGTNGVESRSATISTPSLTRAPKRLRGQKGWASSDPRTLNWPRGVTPRCPDCCRNPSHPLRVLPHCRLLSARIVWREFSMYSSVWWHPSTGGVSPCPTPLALAKERVSSPFLCLCP